MEEEEEVGAKYPKEFPGNFLLNRSDIILEIGRGDEQEAMVGCEWLVMLQMIPRNGRQSKYLFNIFACLLLRWSAKVNCQDYLCHR